MTKSFRTLDDVDVKGKRVLLRVDLNVPMENGRVTDATRLERVAPTITEIADKGGKVILLAHFGRPKGRDAKDSLKPVAEALSKVIKKPVAFAEDCVGEPAANAIAAARRPGGVAAPISISSPEVLAMGTPFRRAAHVAPAASLGAAGAGTRGRPKWSRRVLPS